ncbi:TPA: hypothetical protein H1016_03790 [archaeon]|uniref:Uncharacterized protein n=1 Tax=Candidatus Naiadarchaeum limnaeum TaxID=2756139 RepID=A0A832XIE0_9ARCH|nr:hypothetical protein [Candidatus Naiadarchaeum limnaeum]
MNLKKISEVWKGLRYWQKGAVVGAVLGVLPILLLSIGEDGLSNLLFLLSPNTLIWLLYKPLSANQLGAELWFLLKNSGLPTWNFVFGLNFLYSIIFWPILFCIYNQIRGMLNR